MHFKDSDKDREINDYQQQRPAKYSPLMSVRQNEEPQFRSGAKD